MGMGAGGGGGGGGGGASLPPDETPNYAQKKIYLDWLFLKTFMCTHELKIDR